MPAKGHKLSQASKDKMSIAKKGENAPWYGKFGIEHNRWKGEDAKYTAIHNWARRTINKPKRCSICNKIKKLDCCNVDHKYQRVIEEWFYACRQCHVDYDKENNLR